MSINTASSHAIEAGLDIAYRIGTGEHLPVSDSEFDLAYSCDVLEHVSDLERTISEISRSLKPRGVLFFDTINRTKTSKFLAIKVMQEWRPTRIIDASIHDWRMFIKPEELVDVMRSHGLLSRDIVGLAPRARPPKVLLNFYRANRGSISVGELSRRLDVGQVKNTRVSYMGYATKSG